jgi:hypothetical protein
VSAKTRSPRYGILGALVHVNRSSERVRVVSQHAATFEDRLNGPGVAWALLCESEDGDLFTAWHAETKTCHGSACVYCPPALQEAAS